MERICEPIRASHEEMSVEQIKAKATAFPLRLTFG